MKVNCFNVRSRHLFAQENDSYYVNAYVTRVDLFESLTLSETG